MFFVLGGPSGLLAVTGLFNPSYVAPLPRPYFLPSGVFGFFRLNLPTLEENWGDLPLISGPSFVALFFRAKFFPYRAFGFFRLNIPFYLRILG